MMASMFTEKLGFYTVSQQSWVFTQSQKLGFYTVRKVGFLHSLIPNVGVVGCNFVACIWCFDVSSVTRFSCRGVRGGWGQNLADPVIGVEWTPLPVVYLQGENAISHWHGSI